MKIQEETDVKEYQIRKKKSREQTVENMENKEKEVRETEPETGQRGTQAAGAGRTGHDHTEQRSVCDRNFMQGYQRYLYPAFYAGRVVCQMGNRAYYGGTAG